MTALIVDDENYVICALRANIDWQALDIDTVLTANSVRRAKEMFRQYKIDILLTDIEMPQASGLDLLEWVRNNGFAVEAMLLTSYANFDYARRAISLNILDYYLKPVSFDQLTEGLRKAVCRARETDYVKELKKRVPMANDSRHAEEKEDFENDAGNMTRESKAVGEIISFIDSHFCEQIKRSELAKIVFFSEDYLERCFKKTTGMTIGTYIIDRRMKRAAYLLTHSRMPIKDVSGDVGYDNFSYFTKLFRRAYGSSPMEYRNEYGLSKDL